MAGHGQVWDPLRRKMVAATPEEEVRQWFIGVLKESAKVPAHLMMSEVSLSVGAKDYRADILVWDRSGNPLAVVECKRPDVRIDEKVSNQAMRYNMALGVRWLILTNGGSTYVFHRTESGFEACGTLPEYDSMLK